MFIPITHFLKRLSFKLEIHNSAFYSILCHKRTGTQGTVESRMEASKNVTVLHLLVHALFHTRR